MIGHIFIREESSDPHFAWNIRENNYRRAFHLGDPPEFLTSVYLRLSIITLYKQLTEIT